MDFGGIVSGLLGFASGGWGSFASIIVLVIGAFVVFRMVKKAKQDQAHQNSIDQAAVDAAQDIAQNQSQSQQAAADSAANDAAHAQAISDLAASNPQRPAQP